MPLSKCNCEGCELKGLFFSELTNDEIEAVCTWKDERSYKKGEYILREGDPIKEFCYTKSGLVKLVRSVSDQEEQIIYFASSLDFISLLGIFSNDTYPYSVVAIEDTVVCSLRISEVKTFIRTNGNFAFSVIQKLNRVSDNIITTNLEIKRRRLPGRIAYILLYFANDIYKHTTFELPVSRKEIADFIGMTTENVIRTLSEFRRDGIIKISGKTIEIVDMDKLLKIKQFG
ncbi:MAG TPA: Crp/Fnr family transcriptional regulator [Bacteroidales bacterium]|nr:Crp/Fnr family transcriptional regulator [Bacteroidales bacterium]HPO65770.1 Crp/Fnr family transcriptional regulator [Bacteroidales bacterium]